MRKKVVVLLLSALLSAASLFSFGIYGAYRWALWRVAHPAPGAAYSIAVIGGADGPTVISDTVVATIGGSMEFYLAAGAALLAGAVGLLLWARKAGNNQ